MVKLKSILFFFIGTTFGIAQTDSISNSSFTTYDEKVTASLYFIDTSNSFDFSFESNGQKQQIELIPNKQAQIGVNLNYKFIDISYGFSPSFFNENKDNKDSKLFTISTRFFIKKWVQSFSFINQKGFYVKEDATFFFPRLRTTKIGGTTSYVFNDKFSLKTIGNQNEWQTKSAGSFIPNFNFYYTNFDLNEGGSGNTSDLYLATVSASYFYNLVLKEKILISAGLTPGIGLNAVDGVFSKIYELTYSLKMGYNIDSFFSFVNLNLTDFKQSSESTINVNDNFTTLKFTVGYRFNPPKKVKSFYDKIAKKIGT